MCVTGLSIWHVGERFQRSHETMSKCFTWIFALLSSGVFYAKYVQLPFANDPALDVIRSNLKFWPFFHGAIGAMDGTHVNVCQSAAKWHAA
ncbi:hypothetical protein BDZ94DRAFT_1171745 [Collybia nuda]|uniref:DDE Tnp4 domain-containing protein n=1 Tax=Collybia nuda TaxID=64659 RepID=A0A9P5XXE3_9AGAR|nr:hypothetical protein BDZ94DRAFT_1171745 [Collybia nuda]